ncbi:MAG: phosphotransferase family protein, partial [Spirochaetota bacterium]
PWTVTCLARMLAALHHTVHQTGIDALPSQKESLSYAITSTSLLDDAAKEQVLAILSRLPHGNTVCHGDFHPDNILLTSDGPVIIDWITCTNGTAAADIARSQILMMKSALPPGMHPITQRILLRFRSLFYATYIREYRKRSGITDDEINAWMLPVAAARLNENLFPEEVDLLLTIIRRYTALSSPQKDKRQKEHETLHHTSR